MRALLICLGLLCLHLPLATSPALAQTKPAAFESPAALFNHLAGRWGGTGTIKWRSGQLEPFKCVTTFFVKDGGSKATQNFRCNGTSEYIGDGKAMRLDLTLDWTLQGDKLTAVWHERIYEIRGTATGHVKGNQIVADILSDVATAKITLTVDGCEARAVMHFSQEVDRLDASGRKC